MKIILFANTDWYLYNFRLSLAKALKRNGHKVILVSPPGPYGRLMEREGFRWGKINMNRRSLNPWHEGRTIMEIISLYRRELPDIVHHFTIKCVIYGSIAADLTKVRAKVNALTGLGYIFMNDSLYAKVLRIFVTRIFSFILKRKNSMLILQNPDDLDAFLRNKLIEPGQVELIRGSGVDTRRFVSESGRREKGFRVLLATRLLWDKGVGEYVEAARIVKAKKKSVDFLMAGAVDDGNPASISKEEIEKWREEGVVVPLGHVDHMEKLLGRVDLVVLPSSYGEGVPKILLEAAASGLPIVATDVPGCREIVSHGENGLLIPQKDAAALAEAIQFLIDNPHLCKKMGRAGRKKVLAEFDERIIIEQTLNVYKKLLS